MQKELNGVIYLDRPLEINISDWLNSHIGRTSLAKKENGKTYVFAYAKDKSAIPELRKIRKKENAMLLVSISDGETDAID